MRAIVYGAAAFSIFVAMAFCLALVAVGSAAPAPVPMVALPLAPPRREEPELDVDALLWAIRQVESGDRPAKIGGKGERSAYQFMPAIWRFHTRVPFAVATTNPEIADTIARRHLRQLRKELAGLRLPWAPEFIGAAWHHGSPKAAGHVRDDDAQRVGVLYRARMNRRDAR